jgi:dihydrofolate reductase
MRKLGVFNFVTLNGFYKGAGNDISWHQHGGEESSFSEEGAQSGGILLFGRVTYEMMAAFWPTEDAKKAFPLVADGMNKSEKIVFSNTLKKADWNNTKIVSGDIAETVKKMKQQPGKDMTILGSGSIVSLLTDHGLIDHYQIMVDPLALGKGTPIFNDISRPLQLELVATRIFKSGVILLTYQPLKK